MTLSLTHMCNDMAILTIWQNGDMTTLFDIERVENLCAGRFYHVPDTPNTGRVIEERNHQGEVAHRR